MLQRLLVKKPVSEAGPGVLLLQALEVAARAFAGAVPFAQRIVCTLELCSCAAPAKGRVLSFPLPLSSADDFLSQDHLGGTQLVGVACAKARSARPQARAL